MLTHNHSTLHDAVAASTRCERDCIQESHLLYCMQDDDPYVRKTAAVCVAKLFDINPELVEDRGFLDMLRVSPN